jgi:hypothetical protein
MAAKAHSARAIWVKPWRAGQGDGTVAQTSHPGGSGADADARAVLLEGDIAHIMGAVLDPPGSAVELQELTRVGLPGCQAGKGEEGRAALFAGLQLAGFALAAAELSDMREVDVRVERRAGEQLPLSRV